MKNQPEAILFDYYIVQDEDEKCNLYSLLNIIGI